MYIRTIKRDKTSKLTPKRLGPTPGPSMSRRFNERSEHETPACPVLCADHTRLGTSAVECRGVLTESECGVNRRSVQPSLDSRRRPGEHGHVRQRSRSAGASGLLSSWYLYSSGSVLLAGPARPSIPLSYVNTSCRRAASSATDRRDVGLLPCQLFHHVRTQQQNIGTPCKGNSNG